MKPYSLILWDFDGTLYEETPQIKEMFAHAACRAVRSQLPKELYRVTTDEAVHSLLKKSREEFGDSFTHFALRGLSESELHKKHHENLDHAMLKPNAKLIEGFAKLEDLGVTSAIVTHGHMIWTKKALERCGLSPFFPENRIVTAEKINYQKKHRGPGAFSAALDTMGISVDPKTVMFVEDKAKNLYFPKEHFGWTTCLVTPESRKNLDHVDVQCAAPENVIDLVIKYNLMISPDQAPSEPVV